MVLLCVTTDPQDCVLFTDNRYLYLLATKKQEREQGRHAGISEFGRGHVMGSQEHLGRSLLDEQRRWSEGSDESSEFENIEEEFDRPLGRMVVGGSRSGRERDDLPHGDLEPSNVPESQATGWSLIEQLVIFH